MNILDHIKTLVMEDDTKLRLVVRNARGQVGVDQEPLARQIGAKGPSCRALCPRWLTDTVDIKCGRNVAPFGCRKKCPSTCRKPLLTCPLFTLMGGAAAVKVR